MIIRAIQNDNDDDEKVNGAQTRAVSRTELQRSCIAVDIACIREETHGEHDGSAVVLSSDDEHGELSSENDDEDDGDYLSTNRPSHHDTYY